jgi:1-acyl-sn-glycerol-3-phosphate acyltransferase
MVKLFRKLAVLVSWVFLSVFFRVRLYNRENIPEKGSLVLYSNHKSEFDMFVIGYRIKRWVYWMAKEELFRIPLIGQALNLLGAFPIKRGKGDVNSIKRAYELLEGGHVVGIFPGGTRNRSGNERIARIKPGAVILASKSGAPMMPVAVRSNYKLFGKVEVFYGKPFYLEMDKNKKYSREELVEISREAMEKVYALLEGN